MTAAWKADPQGDEQKAPTLAGIYDYYLGGTNNTADDRAAAEQIIEVMPEVRVNAVANRAFLARAIRWMAIEHGIGQFVDLGAGLPTSKCTHEIAREINPDVRVLYTDRDPRVIARGREMLANVPGTAIIEADLRAVDGLLADPECCRVIDFSRPVGLLMLMVTQFIPDSEDPWNLISRYVGALAPGSFLALTAPTSEQISGPKLNRTIQVYTTATPAARARTKAEIGRFFAGLKVAPPYPGGAAELVFVSRWNPARPPTDDSNGARAIYAAVGRKPLGG